LIKRTTILALGLFAACEAGRPSEDRGGEGAIEGAIAALGRGDVDGAEALLRPSRTPEASLLRARLLLLRNRNREVVDLLLPIIQEKAQTVHEAERKIEACGHLAAAYVRLDDFAGASRTYALLQDSILAKKYETLARKVGFVTNLGQEEVRIELESSDPLPHVSMGVNGRVGLFLVDTALDEIVLDRDFAARARVNAIGIRTDAFQASFDEAIVEEVTLGRLTVTNLPVHLGRLAPHSKVRADGAIGLSFLMHFDFTLDLRRARLSLRRPGSALAGAPALLAGDRYLLSPASVNGGTGLYAGLATALDVLVAGAPSLGSAVDEVREVGVGSFRLSRPPLDQSAFPAGLDSSFGVPVAFVLGHGALRDRAIRLEPRSMRIVID
jgi:hypothetical protein